MANVTFKLRKPKSPTPQIIYLMYRFGRNDKLAFSTDLKVLPIYWNEKKMRIRNVVEVLERDTINNRLNELQAVVEAYIVRQKVKSIKITKESIRAFLLDYVKPQRINNGNALEGFIEDFIKEAPLKINPTTGKRINPARIYVYKKFDEYLKGFEKSKGRKYDFEDINLDFYEDFTIYLQGLKLAANTIAKHIKVLKAILNEATEKGINTNTAYKSRRFKSSEEATESIYLSIDELEKLHTLDLSTNERLNRVRDLFLMGAFTGLRFSDLTRIKSENIKGDYLEIEQQKTGKPVIIPLHPIVSEIWKIYNGKLPTSISNQKFNEYIKEVCKLAGIVEVEQKNKTVGGMRVQSTYKKYELIGSHTARRSFATNLYLSGFPALSIMQITGHKTEGAFMRYIRVKTKQHADLLRKHWAKTGEFMRIAK